MIEFSKFIIDFAEQMDPTFSHNCLSGKDYSSHIFWGHGQLQWFFTIGELFKLFYDSFPSMHET